MEYQFCAEISDFKIISNILKAVSFKEFAIVRLNEEGLKVTIEEMKCTETSVYIPSSLFASYYIDANEDVKFRISLKVLTECLQIFEDDANPWLKVKYKSDGHPLCLVMKHSEENITIDCEIKTMDVEEFVELSLADECNLSKIVLTAGSLVELLLDLDNSSDELELFISPDVPHFKIVTKGIMGKSVINIPKSCQAVLLFQCNKTTTFRYSFSSIKQIFKAMSFANKISILVGDSGLLGFQLLVKLGEKEMYVEFYITALCDVE